MARTNPQPIKNYVEALPEQAIQAVKKLPRKWKGIEIPAQILADRRLSPTEKLLFGFLLTTDITDAGSFWSNNSIEELLNISQPVITNSFAKFSKLGLASIEYKHLAGRTLRTVRSLVKLGLVKEDTLKDSFSDTPRNLLDNISSKEDIVNNKLNTSVAKNPRDTSDKLHPSATAAKERAQARQKQPNPSIHKLVQYFSSRYEEINGRKYPATKTKDYPAVKRALASMSLGDVIKCIDFFLTSEKTKWARDEMGVTVNVALSQKIITKFHGSNKPERSGDNGKGFSGAKVFTYSNV